MLALSKEKRNQIIAVVLGTLAVVAGLWLGVIQTRKQGLEEAKVRLTAAQNRLSNARTYVLKSELIENELESVLEKLQVVEKDMASGDLYAWSLLLMDKARAGHDIDVQQGTRPDRRAITLIPQFPYEAAFFSVQCVGYYHDFGKFLADFENRFPYFHVQNLTLSAGGESGTEAITGRSNKEKLLIKMDVLALIKPTP
jgi:Tfp pilus assembly protein PilO